MKIIGGPWDGREVAFDDRGRDFVVHELLDKESVIDFLRSEIGRVDPVGPSIKQHIYTLRRVPYSMSGGGAHIFEFLAPGDWSDLDAIKHQFTK